MGRRSSFDILAVLIFPDKTIIKPIGKINIKDRKKEVKSGNTLCLDDSLIVLA
jgi:hypothetical protein